MRLVKVCREWPGATLVPPVSLKLDLERAGGPRAVGGPKAPAGVRPGRERRPARFEKWGDAAGGQQSGTVQLVDGSGDGGRSEGRVHEGRNPEEARSRSAGARAACSPELERLLRALGS